MKRGSIKIQVTIKMLKYRKYVINVTGALKMGLEIGYFYVYFNGRII